MDMRLKKAMNGRGKHYADLTDRQDGADNTFSAVYGGLLLAVSASQRSRGELICVA